MSMNLNNKTHPSTISNMNIPITGQYLSIHEENVRGNFDNGPTFENYILNF